MTAGASVDSLERSWLKRLKGQRGVTRAEWPAFIDRLDGSRGNCQDVIKAMNDVELLQFWNASRQCALFQLDDSTFAELRDLAWTEISRRAHNSLAEAG